MISLAFLLQNAETPTENLFLVKWLPIASRLFHATQLGVKSEYLRLRDSYSIKKALLEMIKTDDIK